MSGAGPAAVSRRARRPVSATVVAVAVLVVGFAVAGCASHAHKKPPASTLATPMTGSAAGVTLSNTRADRPYTFGGLVVCIRGTAPVQVTKVTLGSAENGLRVSDFGVRPQRNTMIGAVKRTVGQISGFSQSRKVDARCADKAYFELAVTVEKPGRTSARASTFEVSYRSTGGGTGKVSIPFAVGLCSGDSSTTKGCESLAG